MNKEQILGLVRQILTFGGVYLATKGIVDSATIELVIGAILAITVTIWGWIDKSNRELSVWLSLTRHLVSAIGAIVVGTGILSESLFNDISGIVIGLVSVILSVLENRK